MAHLGYAADYFFLCQTLFLLILCQTFILIPVDVSDAFDIIDHDIPLQRLHIFVGI